MVCREVSGAQQLAVQTAFESFYQAFAACDMKASCKISIGAMSNYTCAIARGPAASTQPGLLHPAAKGRKQETVLSWKALQHLLMHQKCNLMQFYSFSHSYATLKSDDMPPLPCVFMSDNCLLNFYQKLQCAPESWGFGESMRGVTPFHLFPK